MSGASDDRYVCQNLSVDESSTDRYLVGAQCVDSSNLPRTKTVKTTSSGEITLVRQGKVRPIYRFSHFKSEAQGFRKCLAEY